MDQKAPCLDTRRAEGVIAKNVPEDGDTDEAEDEAEHEDKDEEENEGEEEEEDNPVKYLVTNKIDAPSAPIIGSYGFRWRIETFFEDSKQDLGFGECEVERSTSARRHWHMVMLAYSLLRLDPAESADNTVEPTATSVRTEWEWSLKAATYNLVRWVREKTIDQSRTS